MKDKIVALNDYKKAKEKQKSKDVDYLVSVVNANRSISQNPDSSYEESLMKITGKCNKCKKEVSIFKTAKQFEKDRIIIATCKNCKKGKVYFKYNKKSISSNFVGSPIDLKLVALFVITCLFLYVLSEIFVH